MFGELSLPTLSAFLILHSTLSDRGNGFRHMEQDHISKARDFGEIFECLRAGLAVCLRETVIQREFRVPSGRLIFSQPLDCHSSLFKWVLSDLAGIAAHCFL